MNSLLLLFAAPIFSFLLLGFAGRAFSPKAAWISVLAQLVCLVITIYIFTQQWGKEPLIIDFDWFNLAESISIRSGIWIDSHTAIMLLAVNLVSFLVSLYSISYLKHEKHHNRYFAYLSFFVMAMNGLVLADNLLMLFMFWELVGFASYLLIGFWFNKQAAVIASKKAFIINRIADLGLLAAILIFWSEYDTLNIHQLKHVVFHFHESFLLLHLAGFGLFLGCMGKSAQFPFQIWLPDAMEGPTPVSALIHAATMVAAGVYLLVKMAFLLTPDVLQTIAIVGSVTAFFGAFFAISQTDLKRVLAFSTISQLGFMVAGIGSGGTEAAFFHLITHAFFKAGLFLCAGSVIHALQHANHELGDLRNNTNYDPQDMSKMGGLWKKMPITFIAYIVCGLALAGIPIMSGFLSKEAILVAVYANALACESAVGFIFFALLAATSCLTAYYVSKQLYMIFGGQLKASSLLSKIYESSWPMAIPMALLALLSFGFVFSLNPFDFENGWMMRELMQNHEIYGQNHGIVTLFSVMAAFIGITGFAIRFIFVKKNFTQTSIVKFSYNQLYINELLYYIILKPSLYFSNRMAYFDAKVIDLSVNLVGVSQVVFANMVAWVDKKIVDAIVNGIGFTARGIGKLFSQTQNGQIQAYILYTLMVVVGVLLFVFAYF